MHGSAHTFFPWIFEISHQLLCTLQTYLGIPLETAFHHICAPISSVIAPACIFLPPPATFPGVCQLGLGAVRRLSGKPTPCWRPDHTHPSLLSSLPVKWLVQSRRAAADLRAFFTSGWGSVVVCFSSRVRWLHLGLRCRQVLQGLARR